MEPVLGFATAALIAITGVGAGTITTSLLILFLHVPVPAAIGAALACSAAVKLMVVPVQVWCRKVVRRTLGVMLLAAAILPVGAEVGFSSSGAGALGTLALLDLSALEPAQIVGTDLAFGRCLTHIGGTMHSAHGGVDAALLAQLVAGGVLGGLEGSGVAPRIPSHVMRLALSVWFFAMGLQLCRHALTHVRG